MYLCPKLLQLNSFGFKERYFIPDHIELACKKKILKSTYKKDTNKSGFIFLKTKGKKVLCFKTEQTFFVLILFISEIPMPSLKNKALIGSNRKSWNWILYVKGFGTALRLVVFRVLAYRRLSNASEIWARQRLTTINILSLVFFSLFSLCDVGHYFYHRLTLFFLCLKLFATGMFILWQLYLNNSERKGFSSFQTFWSRPKKFNLKIPQFLFVTFVGLVGFRNPPQKTSELRRI